jgi:putative lipase involved disintegration of autophagic bodies
VVHRGFVSGYRKVLTEIDAAVGGSSVIFTGHSFGAAVALLYAEAFNSPVVTFGCPRVYLRWFDTPKVNHARYVCDDDPVVWVPRFFYRHVAEPIMLTDGDGRHMDFKDHGIEIYKERLTKCYPERLAFGCYSPK